MGLFFYGYDSTYFYKMKRGVGMLAFIIACSSSTAQIHVEKLIIKAKQKYLFGQSDIVVADTLIMEDSSAIVLNRFKKENYIHSKLTIIGNHCFIDGSGLNGKSGSAGLTGNSPIGPCKSGANATPGKVGIDGSAGLNLFLYLEKVVVKSPLLIQLGGGNGGNGGKGGEGGSGTSGTVHCKGGNGGVGGDAGNGGNGGNGGTLTIHCPSSLKELMDKKFTVKNLGGAFGKGGRGGYPGSAGLGPAGKIGRPGMPGKEGVDGQLGKNGTFSFVLH